MQQVLHLQVVDRHRECALAAWYGTRWLLPVLTCRERGRAARAAARWAAGHGIASDIAGQWLGRVGPDATDWLMAIRAAQPPSVPDPALQWTPLRTLSSTVPLIEYQGWAIARSGKCGSLPSVLGPFGNLTWVDDVRAWIGGATGAAPGAVTPYRVSAHEVVLGVETPGGRMYFKGLTAVRAAEARLTETLAAMAPSSFASTLAVDERPDGSVWWLTAECPGTAGQHMKLVAGALARLQGRVMASGPVIRELRPLVLGTAARWAIELVDDTVCAGAITRHAERVAAAPVPESWIPMDLDPTNVLVDGGGTVRFIDLDDSYLGPAPLAMATFAQRCGDRSLYRAYEQSWSPPLARIDWPGFEVMATVVEAWLGWQRVECHTRRGEVHGALELAATRLRERLASAVHRR